MKILLMKVSCTGFDRRVYGAVALTPELLARLLGKMDVVRRLQDASDVQRAGGVFEFDHEVGYYDLYGKSLPLDMSEDERDAFEEEMDQNDDVAVLDVAGPLLAWGAYAIGVEWERIMVTEDHVWWECDWGDGEGRDKIETPHLTRAELEQWLAELAGAGDEPAPSRVSA